MLFRQKDNFLTKCAPHRLRLFTTQRAKITGPQLSVHHRPAGDILLGQPRKGVGHRQCGSLQEGKGLLLRPQQVSSRYPGSTVYIYKIRNSETFISKMKYR